MLFMSTAIHLKNMHNRLYLPEQKDLMVLHPLIYKNKQFSNQNWWISENCILLLLLLYMVRKEIKIVLQSTFHFIRWKSSADKKLQYWAQVIIKFKKFLLFSFNILLTSVIKFIDKEKKIPVSQIQILCTFSVRNWSSGGTGTGPSV